MGTERSEYHRPGAAIALALGLALLSARAQAQPCTAGGTVPSRGTYGVGVLTTTLIDTSRPTQPSGSYPGSAQRRLLLEVWYPAQADPQRTEVRGAPAAAGTFALLVLSHGYGGSRRDQVSLAEHLASYGFVVAAPDFPLTHLGSAIGFSELAIEDLGEQARDVSFILDRLTDPEQVSALALPAVKARAIGLLGLSWGGSTSMVAAFHRELGDRRVRAVLAMAPGSCFFARRFFARRVPAMFVVGDADYLVPPASGAIRSFKADPWPRYLAIIRGGNHVGFTEFGRVLDGTNSDVIGCAVVAGAGDQTRVERLVAALGGKKRGVGTNHCVNALPCAGEPREAIAAARQIELTELLAVPFFQSYLGRTRRQRRRARRELRRLKRTLRCELRLRHRSGRNR